MTHWLHVQEKRGISNKTLGLLRLTCPDGTQCGGCDRDRVREGASSLAKRLPFPIRYQQVRQLVLRAENSVWRVRDLKPG